jgi:hypothetical protein
MAQHSAEDRDGHIDENRLSGLDEVTNHLKDFKELSDQNGRDSIRGTYDRDGDQSGQHAPLVYEKICEESEKDFHQEYPRGFAVRFSRYVIQDHEIDVSGRGLLTRRLSHGIQVFLGENAMIKERADTTERILRPADLPPKANEIDVE